MLREITDIRQDNPAVRRRWFHDDYFDLYLWQSPGAGIVGFQLCYDIHADERVLSWHETSGYSHNRIDAGEATPIKNMTPILVADGQLPIDDVLPRFLDHSRGIEPVIGEFVLRKLRDYGKRLPPSGTARAHTRAAG